MTGIDPASHRGHNSRFHRYDGLLRCTGEDFLDSAREHVVT
jgi:hypothetical protein